MFIFTEAEETWQYILKDRQKRQSTNTVTAYCEKIAKVYSKNPPTSSKPAQKMRLLDRVKIKQSSERPPPLPPLVPNFMATYYPGLLTPGENGMRQQCTVLDVRENGAYVEDEKIEKPRWGGIEDIILAYTEYSKGN